MIRYWIKLETGRTHSQWFDSRTAATLFALRYVRPYGVAWEIILTDGSEERAGPARNAPGESAGFVP